MVTLLSITVFSFFLLNACEPGVSVCRVGWIGRGSWCYRLLNTGWSSMTWPQARAECQLYGADLASIHSDEENDWLVDTFSPRVVSGKIMWIGLNTSTSGDAWSDGSVYNYSNWLENARDYGCARVGYGNGVGDWIRSPCSQVSAGYLCKMEAEMTAPPATSGPRVSLLYDATSDVVAAAYAISTYPGSSRLAPVEGCALVCHSVVGCRGFNLHTDTSSCDLLNLNIMDSSAAYTRVNGDGNIKHYYFK